MSKEIETYTPTQLAKLIQCPKRTVLRAIMRKELKAVRFSSCVIRVLVTDAEKWIHTLRK